MDSKKEIQHVYLVGAKSLGAYGGYETFVYKLTEYHQNKENIKYHVACKANGDGCMDETKFDGVTKINDHEFEFHNAHYSEFHFDPLAGKEMDRVFANSKCVLDSAQAGQIGLTIRVLEALGAKKKLITTNEDVVNYDFYREENIYVYDGHFDLKAPFFNSDYVEVENSVYTERMTCFTMVTSSCWNVQKHWEII